MSTDVHDRIKKIIKQFLIDDDENVDEIENLRRNHKTRLVVSIYHFNKVNQDFSQRLIHDPFTFLPPCEEAFQEAFEADRAEDTIRRQYKPRLGFNDWFGSHTVTPRGLSSRVVNKMVCVEGIVTRCSLVLPKLVTSVQLIEDANSSRHEFKLHNDSTSVSRDKYLNRHAQPSLADSKGLKTTTEVGLSDYKDFQRLTIQEMPENAPSGQLPRAVEVVVEDDLTGVVKPGDRVQAFGVYRCVAAKEGGRLTGHTRSFIVCNNLEQLRQDLLAPDINPLELRHIKKLAEQDDTFEVLSRSIAPSICGHDQIKKGLLLQFIGCERKELSDGMKIRGDIHILLIGDPSCGKSQLLRFTMNTSPLALSTTGRGSSGVGLTAAVTVDKDTGERGLEAGAMVSADMGVVCIDEFDKMSAEDRMAIHEVMEQQTVTITKAGIQTSLNARCSVLAAANPLYGTFDETTNLKKQICFPDSLLSRFDLIFVMRDSQSSEQDRMIATQVLKQLRYRSETDTFTSVFNAAIQAKTKRSAADAIIQPHVQPNDESGDGAICQRNSQTAWRDASLTILTVKFLQKYIHYCKYHLPHSPDLSKEAVEEIALFYAQLRQRFVPKSNGNSSGLSIPTARTLEACIRLASAHARLKMRKSVLKSDVKVATDLLLFTLCGEVSNDPTLSSDCTLCGEVSNDPTLSSDCDDISIDTTTPYMKAANPSEASDNRKRHRTRDEIAKDNVANISSALDSLSLGDVSSATDDTMITQDDTNILSATKKRCRDGRNVSQTLRNVSQTLTNDSTIDNAEMISSDATSQSSTGRKPINATRLKELTRNIVAAQETLSVENVQKKDLLEMVNSRISNRANKFSQSEYDSGIQYLQEQNKIMEVQDLIWFV